MDINRNNYETFFLLYLDRELNHTDRQAVENFLNENTDLQKEFALLQQTIQLPLEIVFEQKDLLLHKEEKRRFIPVFGMRIAAAIALLLTGSWFLMTVVVKNPSALKAVSGNNYQTNQAGEKAIAKNKNLSNRTGENGIAYNHNEANQSGENSLAENQHQGKTAVQKNILNQTGYVHPGMRKQYEKTIKDNQNLHVPSSNPDPGKTQPRDFPVETLPAVQESGTALEIQSADMKTVPDSKLVPSVSGTELPSGVLAAASQHDQAKNVNANLKEPDVQTDNAISVLALNDRNKAIAGFFKKLTRHAPADETANNTKKLRISVFQFSY